MNPGTYKARVGEVALSTTKSGKDQVSISLAVIDGDNEEYHTYYGYFSDGALSITLKALRTCGWKGTNLLEVEKLGGQIVQVVLDNETWEGKTRLKVKWINDGSGPVVQGRMDDAQKRAFADRMAGKILAAGGDEKTPF